MTVLKDGNGQLWYKPPGAKGPQDLVAIESERDLETINEGGLEAFVKQTGQGVGALAGGALELGEAAGRKLGLTDSTQFAEINRATERDQGLRARANPAGAGLGTVAGIAPDVALGIATGGAGPLARRAAMVGATEGGLGALRSPQDPVAGAALQGGIGVATLGAGAGVAAAAKPLTKGAARGLEIGKTVVDRVRGRAPAGAQIVEDTSGFVGTQRNLEGLLTPAQLDEMGFPVTNGDRAALDAMRGTDQYSNASALRAAEEGARSAELGSITNLGQTLKGRRGVNAVRAEQEAFVTRSIGALLGDPNIENLTRFNRGSIRKEVSAVFDDAINKGDVPIPGTATADSVAQEVAVATGNAAERAKYWSQEVASKVQADGTFDRAAFSSLRSGLGDDIDRAFNSGNHELGTVLSRINEILDDALQGTLTPDVQAALAEARTRWRVLKALERVNTVDAGGEVNIRSFTRAYEAVTPGFRKASRKMNDFEQLLDTANFTLSKPVPNSGTADRLIAAAGKSRVPGGGAVMMGLGLGG